MYTEYFYKVIINRNTGLSTTKQILTAEISVKSQSYKLLNWTGLSEIIINEGLYSLNFQVSNPKYNSSCYK